MPPALVVKIVLPGPGRSYGKGTFPLTSTGGSQLTTKVRVPTSFTVSVTLVPGGRCRATQSVVLYARFETQPLSPAGIEAFGVAVHVGVGPTRVCGGGMTVAAAVGRGVGVAGEAVLGGSVGEDVGGAVGGDDSGAPMDGAAEGTLVVGTGETLNAGRSVAATEAAPLASPQATTRSTTPTSPARHEWSFTSPTMRDNAASG